MTDLETTTPLSPGEESGDLEAQSSVVPEQEASPADDSTTWDGLERRVIRDPRGMIHGAVGRARQKYDLPYVRDPHSLGDIPDNFFRKDDPAEFRDAVNKALKKALVAAKPYQEEILGKENILIHELLIEDSVMNRLKKLLGPNVSKLPSTLNWYVGLTGGDIPSPITPRHLRYVTDEYLNVSAELLDEVTNPEKARVIEAAFREVLKDEKGLPGNLWDKIKDLHGPEFVAALYKGLGVHLGFQGLRAKEMGRLAYSDFKWIHKHLLGDSGAGVLVDEEAGKTGWVRKVGQWFASGDTAARKNRTLDVVNPCIYVAFDNPPFTGMTGPEQMAAIDEINKAANSPLFDKLGVISMFDLACRTAVLRKPEGYAEQLGTNRTRVALDDPKNPGEIRFCVFKYNRSRGHHRREIRVDKFTDGMEASPEIGFACGRVYPLQPLKQRTFQERERK